MAASSISPMIFFPALRALVKGTISSGTPGLTTIRSVSRTALSLLPPVSTAIFLEERKSISLLSFSADLASLTRTLEP
ncbi:MAG: hypothetical protein FD167_4356 [bacterium]|nr:MAG: hypothetical protein FD167_4356 [bacterium]